MAITKSDPVPPGDSIGLGGPQVFEPVDQETTDTYVAVNGVIVDMTFRKTLSIVIKNTDGSNSIDWKVIASNVSDFSESVEIKAEAALAAGAVGSYAGTGLVFRYYQVEVKATTPASQGDAQVQAIAKS